MTLWIPVEISQEAMCLLEIESPPRSGRFVNLHLEFTSRDDCPWEGCSRDIGPGEWVRVDQQRSQGRLSSPTTPLRTGQTVRGQEGSENAAARCAAKGKQANQGRQPC